MKGSKVPKSASMGRKVHFREVQKFTQLWIWLLLGFVAAVTWYMFIVQIFLGTPVGNNPASDPAVWIILIVFGITFPLFFTTLKLTVEVWDEGVMINFFPIKKRFVRFEEIEKAEAMKYKPIRQYGGWGIRLGRGGNAYNVSGNKGVRIELTDGTHVMVGSQKAKELESAIKNAMK